MDPQVRPVIYLKSMLTDVAFDSHHVRASAHHRGNRPHRVSLCLVSDPFSSISAPQRLVMAEARPRRKRERGGAPTAAVSGAGATSPEERARVVREMMRIAEMPLPGDEGASQAQSRPRPQPSQQQREQQRTAQVAAIKRLRFVSAPRIAQRKLHSPWQDEDLSETAEAATGRGVSSALGTLARAGAAAGAAAGADTAEGDATEADEMDEEVGEEAAAAAGSSGTGPGAGAEAEQVSGGLTPSARAVLAVLGPAEAPSAKLLSAVPMAAVPFISCGRCLARRGPARGAGAGRGAGPRAPAVILTGMVPSSPLRPPPPPDDEERLQCAGVTRAVAPPPPPSPQRMSALDALMPREAGVEEITRAVAQAVSAPSMPAVLESRRRAVCLACLGGGRRSVTSQYDLQALASGRASLHAADEAPVGNTVASDLDVLRSPADLENFGVVRASRDDETGAVVRTVGTSTRQTASEHARRVMSSSRRASAFPLRASSDVPLLADARGESGAELADLPSQKTLTSATSNPSGLEPTALSAVIPRLVFGMSVGHAPATLRVGARVQVLPAAADAGATRWVRGTVHEVHPQPGGSGGAGVGEAESGSRARADARADVRLDSGWLEKGVPALRLRGDACYTRAESTVAAAAEAAAAAVTLAGALLDAHAAALSVGPEDAKERASTSSIAPWFWISPTVVAAQTRRATCATAVALGIVNCARAVAEQASAAAEDAAGALSSRPPGEGRGGRRGGGADARRRETLRRRVADLIAHLVPAVAFVHAASEAVDVATESAAAMIRAQTMAIARGRAARPGEDAPCADYIFTSPGDGSPAASGARAAPASVLRFGTGPGTSAVSQRRTAPAPRHHRGEGPAPRRSVAAIASSLLESAVELRRMAESEAKGEVDGTGERRLARMSTVQTVQDAALCVDPSCAERAGRARTSSSAVGPSTRAELMAAASAREASNALEMCSGAGSDDVLLAVAVKAESYFQMRHQPVHSDDTEGDLTQATTGGDAGPVGGAGQGTEAGAGAARTGPRRRLPRSMREWELLWRSLARGGDDGEAQLRFLVAIARDVASDAKQVALLFEKKRSRVSEGGRYGDLAGAVSREARELLKQVSSAVFTQLQQPSDGGGGTAAGWSGVARFATDAMERMRSVAEVSREELESGGGPAAALSPQVLLRETVERVGRSIDRMHRVGGGALASIRLVGMATGKSEADVAEALPGRGWGKDEEEAAATSPAVALAVRATEGAWLADVEELVVDMRGTAPSARVSSSRVVTGPLCGFGPWRIRAGSYVSVARPLGDGSDFGFLTCALPSFVRSSATSARDVLASDGPEMVGVTLPRQSVTGTDEARRVVHVKAFVRRLYPRAAFCSGRPPDARATSIAAFGTRAGAIDGFQPYPPPAAAAAGAAARKPPAYRTVAYLMPGMKSVNRNYVGVLVTDAFAVLPAPAVAETAAQVVRPGQKLWRSLHVATLAGLPSEAVSAVKAVESRILDRVTELEALGAHVLDASSWGQQAVPAGGELTARQQTAAEAAKSTTRQLADAQLAGHALEIPARERRTVPIEPDTPLVDLGRVRVPTSSSEFADAAPVPRVAPALHAVTAGPEHLSYLVSPSPLSSTPTVPLYASIISDAREALCCEVVAALALHARGLASADGGPTAAARAAAAVASSDETCTSRSMMERAALQPLRLGTTLALAANAVLQTLSRCLPRYTRLQLRLQGAAPASSVRQMRLLVQQSFGMLVPELLTSIRQVGYIVRTLGTLRNLQSVCDPDSEYSKAVHRNLCDPSTSFRAKLRQVQDTVGRKVTAVQMIIASVRQIVNVVRKQPDAWIRPGYSMDRFESTMAQVEAGAADVGAEMRLIVTLPMLFSHPRLMLSFAPIVQEVRKACSAAYRVLGECAAAAKVQPSDSESSTLIAVGVARIGQLLVRAQSAVSAATFPETSQASATAGDATALQTGAHEWQSKAPRVWALLQQLTVRPVAPFSVGQADLHELASMADSGRKSMQAERSVADAAAFAGGWLDARESSLSRAAVQSAHTAPAFVADRVFWVAVDTGLWRPPETGDSRLHKFQCNEARDVGNSGALHAAFLAAQAGTLLVAESTSETRVRSTRDTGALRRSLRAQGTLAAAQTLLTLGLLGRRGPCWPRPDLAGSAQVLVAHGAPAGMPADGADGANLPARAAAAAQAAVQDGTAAELAASRWSGREGGGASRSDAPRPRLEDAVAICAWQLLAVEAEATSVSADGSAGFAYLLDDGMVWVSVPSLVRAFLLPFVPGSSAPPLAARDVLRAYSPATGAVATVPSSPIEAQQVLRSVGVPITASLFKNYVGVIPSVEHLTFLRASQLRKAVAAAFAEHGAASLRLTDPGAFGLREGGGDNEESAAQRVTSEDDAGGAGAGAGAGTGAAASDAAASGAAPAEAAAARTLDVGRVRALLDAALALAAVPPGTVPTTAQLMTFAAFAAPRSLHPTVEVGDAVARAKLIGTSEFLAQPALGDKVIVRAASDAQTSASDAAVARAIALAGPAFSFRDAMQSAEIRGSAAQSRVQASEFALLMEEARRAIMETPAAELLQSPEARMTAMERLRQPIDVTHSLYLLDLTVNEVAAPSLAANANEHSNPLVAQIADQTLAFVRQAVANMYEARLLTQYRAAPALARVIGQSVVRDAQYVLGAILLRDDILATPVRGPAAWSALILGAIVDAEARTNAMCGISLTSMSSLAIAEVGVDPASPRGRAGARQIQDSLLARMALSVPIDMWEDTCGLICKRLLTDRVQLALSALSSNFSASGDRAVPGADGARRSVDRREEVTGERETSALVLLSESKAFRISLTRPFSALPPNTPDWRLAQDPDLVRIAAAGQEAPEASYWDGRRALVALRLSLTASALDSKGLLEAAEAAASDGRRLPADTTEANVRLAREYAICKRAWNACSRVEPTAPMSIAELLEVMRDAVLRPEASRALDEGYANEALEQQGYSSDVRAARECCA